jgi:deoxycytidylate deaminase
MYRPSWDETAMETLQIIAKRSLCCKYSMAAIITCDTHIISIGYNGTYPKQEECIEYWYKVYVKMCRKIRGETVDVSYYQYYSNFSNVFDTMAKKYVETPEFIDWVKNDEYFKLLHREWSKIYELHAEANAIKHMKEFHKEGSNYTLYTMYSPCEACTELILKNKDSISRVVYKYLHKNVEGIRKLQEANIKVEQLIKN